MRILRDYQREAVTYLHESWAAGVIRPPAVLATGLGKTEIFTDPTLLDEFLDAGKRVLIIAHTDELIDQAAKKARRNNPLRKVGIVKATQNETYAQIIISSRQTLGHSTGGPKRLAALRNIGLIIIDEAHHALRTNTYGKILEYFGAFDEPAASYIASGRSSTHAPMPRVAGFTATLARGDKGKLSSVWQEPPSGIFRRDILFGIRRGYLLDVRGKRVVVDGLDMKNVRISGGDYRDTDIAEELERTFAPEVVAQAYLDHSAGRKGIAFWPLVETAYHGAKAFNELGIKSEVIHGELPKSERRAMLARLHSGETRVIHGVGVLTEGFDEPTCDVVVIARPTRSAPFYQQMVGRVLRPDLSKPPAERGKALILDVVGAAANHDLRSLIDLSPERDLSAVDDDDLSLLEMDDEALLLLEMEQEQSTLWGAEHAAEDYTGPASIEEFDPLGRDKLWAQTPGGTWYMSAGDDAYVFLVDTEDGQPGHYDVVLCGKRSTWARTTDYTDLALEEALGWAEDVALDHGGRGAKELTKRKAKWRNEPATIKALRQASRVGAVFPELEEGAPITKGMVSEAIEAAVAARVIDPLVRDANSVVPT
jgi:superfamily II DNA or RNA helicase